MKQPIYEISSHLPDHKKRQIATVVHYLIIYGVYFYVEITSLFLIDKLSTLKDADFDRFSDAF
jgi:hypothetical protein